MAITYQNNSLAVVGTNTSSINISVPTGFSAGDLLIACVTKDGEDGITLPTGWTSIQNNANLSIGFSVSYRVAEAGDTSWSWTGEPETWVGVILRYTGQDTTTPIHASNKSSGASSEPTAPNVSYTDLPTDSLALQCFGADDDDNPYTTPEQLTERYNHVSSTGTGTCGSAGGDKAISGTGSTGTGIFTMNQGEMYIAVTVIIAAESAGEEYYDTVSKAIVATPTKSADFDFKKTLSASETSILTKSVGFQRTLDISGTMTPAELFKFLNTFSLSGTHSTTLSSLFGVTKAFSSNMTPTILKVITFKQTPVITEISALSILKKYFLEKTFSSSSTLDTSILYSILSSLAGTGTLTIIDALGYHAVPTFQTAASLSVPLKFLLIKTLITEAVPTITDIYTLASIISTTINNILGITCKFKLIASNTGLGTPSVSSVLGKFDEVSFEIHGTSSISKIIDYSPIVTINISEQFFVGAFRILIKNIIFTTTSIPTISRKDLLEVLFDEISSLSIYSPTEYSLEQNFIQVTIPTIDIVLSLLASLITTNILCANTKETIELSFTEISILSSLVKFLLEQSLVQIDTAAVDKIISFINIEISSTSSLSIEDILEFILTIPLSTSQNITVEGIQTLIDLISVSTQENLSITLKNILSILFSTTGISSLNVKEIIEILFSETNTLTSDLKYLINTGISTEILLDFEKILSFYFNILLQETSILSHSLKYILIKTLTNDISSTINIAVSYKGTILLTIENVSLITLVEELAKLVLTLEDSQIIDLILSDNQLKDLILSDTQLKDLTLEDL